MNHSVAQDIPENNNWDVRCQKYSDIQTNEGSGKALCPVLGIMIRSFSAIFWIIGSLLTVD